MGRTTKSQRPSQVRPEAARKTPPLAARTDPEMLLFGATAHPRPRTATAMVLTDTSCQHCGSNLVHPLDWENPTEDLWLLALRCPECEREWVAALSRPSVERFIARLHAQKRALASDLARLTSHCFLEEAKRFVAALHAGHILPTDF